MTRRLMKLLMVLSSLVMSLVFFNMSASGQTSTDPDDAYAIDNMALASNGGVATASSTSGTAQASGNYTPMAVIDGDKRGLNWGDNGGWRCATADSYPDWIVVEFNADKIISEIDVFTLQDNYTNPAEPMPAQTFSLFGITNFQVQYWDGSTWVTVGLKINNRNVWSKFTFPSVKTKKIRLNIDAALSSYSRVTEIEAWGIDATNFSSVFAPSSSSTQPAPSEDCKVKNVPDPCAMQQDLLWAAKGGVGAVPQPNWQGHLDWDFSSARNNSSDNWAPLAHSIALWRPRSEFTTVPANDPISWWIVFLDCQNHVRCESADFRNTDPGALGFMKSKELLSNTYDAYVMTAVVAVRYFAIKKIQENDVKDPGHLNYARDPDLARMPALAEKALTYLRFSWALYGLAAGQSPALILKNRYVPQGKDCQRGPNGEWPGFNGYFLSLAGMRSTPSHACTDDRAFIFARALNKPVTALQETADQRNLLNYIQTQWNEQKGKPAFPAPFENAYGLQDDQVALLKSQINNGDQSAFLMQFLANVRTIVTYHFLGWREILPDGKTVQNRATVMEWNTNGNTAPTYAVKFEQGTRTAQMLFPWSNKRTTCIPIRRAWRGGIGRGIAMIDFLHNKITASNVDVAAGEQSNCYQDWTVFTDEMTLPRGELEFHIVLSRDDVPREGP